MAIAFGASLGNVTGGGASSQSLTTLSITGSELAIIAVVRTETVTKTVNSVVWDDGAGGSPQSFTQIGGYVDIEAGNHRISMWQLLAPSTSNSRIIATISANDVMYLSAVYYSGVAQSSAFTNPSSATDTATPGSQADTSDRDGSWHLGIAGSANAGLGAGADTTERVENSNNTAIYDSNATVANTSSHTFNWTWTGGGNAGWVTTMMRPPVAAPVVSVSIDDNMLLR